MKDHIPDWAGGRVALESRSGLDRLHDIVRDAALLMLGPDSPAPITVKQAQELLALAEPVGIAVVQPRCAHCLHSVHSRGDCWTIIGADSNGALRCPCLANTLPEPPVVDASRVPTPPQAVAANEPPEPRRPWPDPTAAMLETDAFERVWQCIKRWDINVPDVYGGYMGATGNHVRAILDALQPAASPTPEAGSPAEDEAKPIERLVGDMARPGNIHDPERITAAFKAAGITGVTGGDVDRNILDVDCMCGHTYASHNKLVTETHKVECSWAFCLCEKFVASPRTNSQTPTARDLTLALDRVTQERDNFQNALAILQHVTIHVDGEAAIAEKVLCQLCGDVMDTIQAIHERTNACMAYDGSISTKARTIQEEMNWIRRRLDSAVATVGTGFKGRQGKPDAAAASLPFPATSNGPRPTESHVSHCPCHPDNAICICAADPVLAHAGGE